jgi:type IV pilus assembly protein PilM
LTWKRDYEQQQKKIKEMKAFIRKYRAGIKSKQARGRKKKLERMDKIPPPPKIETPKISFKSETPTGEEVLTVRDLTKSYEEVIFSEIDFRPNKVVITINSKNVIIRNVTLPVMPKNELKEALKWEIEDYLPFSVEDAVIDYIITETTESEIHLIMVAASQKIISSYTSILKKLYIKPIAVNVQSIALLSLLSFQNNINQPTAVIDIGAANSKVVIGEENQIYLSRTVDIGGRTFTDSLIKTGLEYTKAEEKKKKIELTEPEPEVGEDNELDFDLALNDLEKSDDSQLLYPIAEELVSEISRSIEYFHNHHRGSELNSFFLTGGGSRLSGIQQIIENNIEQEVHRIKPLVGITTQLDLFPEIVEDLSVVMGLALSEVFNNDES